MPNNVTRQGKLNLTSLKWLEDILGYGYWNNYLHINSNYNISQ